jgi:hypothetical protein
MFQDHTNHFKPRFFSGSLQVENRSYLRNDNVNDRLQSFAAHPHRFDNTFLVINNKMLTDNME